MVDHLLHLQDSLAAAIARIEVQRLRLKHLEQENVQLRNALRSHGFTPDEHSTEFIDSEIQEGPKLSVGPPVRQEAGGQRTWVAQPQVGLNSAHGQKGENGSEEETHDVTIVVEGVSAPGQIRTSPKGFHFSATVADVNFEEFVGVRYLPSETDFPKSRRSRRRSKNIKNSWWVSFFGPSGKPSPHSSTANSPNRRTGSAFRSRSVLGPPSASSAWVSTPKPSPPAPTPPCDLPLPPPPRQTISRQSAGAFRRGSPEAPPPQRATLVDSFAAGVQGGLSSISQLTGYLAASRPPPLSRHSSYSSLRSTREFADRDGGGAGVEAGEAASTDSGSGVGGDIAFEAGAVAVSAPQGVGTWQMIWKGAGDMHAVTFSAGVEAREMIQQAVTRWHELTQAQPADDSGVSEATTSVGGFTLQPPVHMAPGEFRPCVDDSRILDADEASALAAALPGRKRLARWDLLYSTASGGFSLQSLYRSGGRAARSVLLVEDFAGSVFGAYCTDPWRVQPRYQGSGETFVFQLRPHRLKYGWRQPSGGSARNDFFMLMGQDSFGIGGAPHFALWLDSDLLFGNSGLCDTFASPVLSSSEDFKIKALELWQVGS